MEKLKIAVCGACLLVVAILGYCYVSKKQNEKYEYIVNSAISNIVDTVIEKYPDVGEEEILNILRNTKNSKTNILKKYGYLNNENYIQKLENEKNIDKKSLFYERLYFFEIRMNQKEKTIVLIIGG